MRVTAMPIVVGALVLYICDDINNNNNNDNAGGLCRF